MANRVILSRKEQFDREIAAYRGDDPLKLRYDFLLWLDSNFGKDKVIDIFTSTLEEALNTHWNDARYKEDNRLIELQMIYATLQPNPLTVYQGYYDRGVAQHSSVLYVNWANHLTAANDFAGADKIFKMGSEKTSSAMKAELNKEFEKFLAVVGRKFLDGEIPAKKEVQCAKCLVQQSAVPAPAAEDVQSIEMNPGKAGCWEDFQTVVAYFDLPDSKSIRMYPKDKVYKDAGKEYSLEEVKAGEYFDKLKKKEQLEAQKLKEKANKKSLSFDPPFEADPVVKEGAFPVPLLPCSGKEDSIAAQSFTTRTKLAMHLVQDMWSSPTPEVQPPMLAKNEENKPKPAFPIYIDDNPETPKAAEKKLLAPFQVLADSNDEITKNNKNPVSLAKKSSTAKKNGLQTKSNVLSERKLKNGEITEEPKAAVKQQLHFENDNANEMLANKLSETSVSDPRTPFQPFGGIKPLFPVEQGKDDFSDLTCNTKAFNFALPSSTPVQQRKSLAPYHSVHQNGGSQIPQDERSSYYTQQNLSVILEASKERCSSSGSSTGSSQPRTPAFPAKTPPKAMSNFRNDISSASSCPGHIGSAPGNRSFTWMSNRSKSRLNQSLKTPNRSQSSEELDPPSTYTCSFLKFRLSSEKLSALKSIKENYFHDQSKNCLVMSSPDGNVSGNRSPLVPIPSVERRNTGALLTELLRAYKSKNEFNISKQTNVLSQSQHRTLGTSVSLLGDTIDAQKSIDFDNSKENCDCMESVSRDSSNTRRNLVSSDISKPMDSKCINHDPRMRNKVRRKSKQNRLPVGSPVAKLVESKRDNCDAKVKNKAKRKSYLHKRNCVSGGSLVSKPVESKRNHCDAKVRSEPKQKSYLSKQNRLSVYANDSSKHNSLGIRQIGSIPSVSLDASNGSPSSSVLKPDPPIHSRDPRMTNRAKGRSCLQEANCSSGNVGDPSTLDEETLGIRKFSIRLSPINMINDSVHSSVDHLHSVAPKRGRPRKHNSLGILQIGSISSVSLDASNGSPPSSVLKPDPPIHCRDHMMTNRAKGRSGLQEANCSSGNVGDPSTLDETLGIRKCSIRLSPINMINDSVHSSVDHLHSVAPKRGRPRKHKVPTRKSSVCTEDSPFTLCNSRKETTISKTGLKRKLCAGSIIDGSMKLSQSRKMPKRNSCITKSNFIGNVDNNYNNRGKRTELAKPSKTRIPSVCYPNKSNQDGVMQVKDVFSENHDPTTLPECRFVMQNKICYRTPVSNKKGMVGSESCPAYRSEPVTSSGMILRSHSQSNEGFVKYKSYSGGFTPSSPQYCLRSASRARSHVPKQLIMEDCNEIDPFCPLTIDKLLAMLNFPQPHHADGYQLVNSNLPTVSKNFRLGNDMFTTYGDLGKGAYARVVRASNESSNFALKIEKPACKWEFYIAREIQRRVDLKTRSGFMDIKTAYIFTNGSVLLTEWAKHGCLLNIINQYKQHTGKVLEPVLSLHFAIEVTRAVEYLHKCKIIHGDIKPDNFVVRSLPTVNETEPCLMLIDFGRSIDMTLFPEGTKFSRVVTTDGFQCNEMKEQKPWSYQTDLYGLAGTIYCLLIGEYMKVVKRNDEWKLHKALPRNMRRELWDPIFHQLLNVPSCEQLPNLTEIRETLEATFADFNHYVKLQYFNHLSNIVMGK